MEMRIRLGLMVIICCCAAVPSFGQGGSASATVGNGSHTATNTAASGLGVLNRSNWSLSTSDQGGAIELRAADEGSRDGLRQHLRSVRRAFANGGVPPLAGLRPSASASTLGSYREVIDYTFEETAHGGRIRITTTNSEALGIVHRYLESMAAQVDNE
jgi:hypothetical protein